MQINAFLKFRTKKFNSRAKLCRVYCLFLIFFPPVVAPYISLVAHKVSMLWVLHIIYVMHNSVYYTTTKIADSGNSYTIIWNSTKIELKHIIWDIQTKDY